MTLSKHKRVQERRQKWLGDAHPSEEAHRSALPVYDMKNIQACVPIGVYSPQVSMPSEYEFVPQADEAIPVVRPRFDLSMLRNTRGQSVCMQGGFHVGIGDMVKFEMEAYGMMYGRVIVLQRGLQKVGVELIFVRDTILSICHDQECTQLQKMSSQIMRLACDAFETPIYTNIPMHKILSKVADYAIEQLSFVVSRDAHVVSRGIRIVGQFRFAYVLGDPSCIGPGIVIRARKLCIYMYIYM